MIEIPNCIGKFLEIFSIVILGVYGLIILFLIFGFVWKYTDGWFHNKKGEK